MPKGKFTAADLDAPQSGQTGQFSAADLDQSSTADTPSYLDKEIPLDSYAHATEQGFQTVGRGVRDAVTGIGNLVMHPIDTAKGIADLPAQAAQVPAAVSDINASQDPVGTYAKVAQETAGQGAGQTLTALATEGIAKTPGIGRVARVAGKVAKGTIDDVPGVRQVGKLAQYWKETAPEQGTPLISKTPLGPETPDPDLLRARSLSSTNTPTAAPASQTGEALGQIPQRGQISKALESPVRTLPGQISPEVIQPPAPPAPKPATPIPPRGGLALPAAPAGAELSDLPATAAKPAAQSGEALGQAPQRGAIAKASAPEAQPIRRGSLSEMLQDQLDQSLGARKLDPKMPLRNQMGATPPAKNIPEGHTPVQSSALRSYKYDPAAREFHARATSGDTTYVYGDVSPEDAATFEQAESKGKAWQSIRSNPLVAKIVNGKRLPITSSAR